MAALLAAVGWAQTGVWTFVGSSNSAQYGFVEFWATCNFTGVTNGTVLTLQGTTDWGSWRDLTNVVYVKGVTNQFTLEGLPDHEVYRWRIPYPATFRYQSPPPY